MITLVYKYQFEIYLVELLLPNNSVKIVYQIIQYFEISLVSHEFMIIEADGIGKTPIMNCLSLSLTDLGIKH